VVGYRKNNERVQKKKGQTEGMKVRKIQEGGKQKKKKDMKITIFRDITSYNTKQVNAVVIL
jgi:hypothetical protein